LNSSKIKVNPIQIHCKHKEKDSFSIKYINSHMQDPIHKIWNQIKPINQTWKRVFKTKKLQPNKPKKGSKIYNNNNMSIMAEQCKAWWYWSDTSEGHKGRSETYRSTRMLPSELANKTASIIIVFVSFSVFVSFLYVCKTERCFVVNRLFRWGWIGLYAFTKTLKCFAVPTNYNIEVKGQNAFTIYHF
jgi:hypothetical protein